MTSGSRRWIFIVAGVGALLVIVAAMPFVLGRSPAGDGSWICHGVSVYAGSNTGPTARAALDRYLDASGTPHDGWNLAEPNRFSRSTPDGQQVVSVNQTDTTTWQVVRSDDCRR